MTERITGGSQDYYKVYVKNPTTRRRGYWAECNDIIEALGLNYAEATVMKAIWRISAWRRGLQQKAHPLYDAEKVLFFGKRVHVQIKSDWEDRNND